MATTSAGAPTILVVAGPGLGHYLPVAALLRELGIPARIVVCAELDADHAVFRWAAADGFEPCPLVVHAGRRGDRALRGLTRALRRRVAPALARRGRAGRPLPRLTARWVFAAATQCTPLTSPRRPVGEAIDGLLAVHRPALVLGEMHGAWLTSLTSIRGIPYVAYTTGPVGDTSRSRPIAPTGLDPALPAPDRMVNTTIWSLRRLRHRRESTVLRRAGVTPPAPGGPRRRVAFGARRLDDPAGTAPRGVDYVGVSPYGLGAWPDRSDDPPRDTVLCTWGSTADAGAIALVERLAPAFAELGDRYRVVIQVDRPDRVSELGVLPAGVAIVGPRPQPLHDEYRRAVAVVCHGGYGTINEAVAWGAPVVVLAEMVADRMETSRRVLTAGVGTSLDRYTVRSPDLVAAVERVAHDPAVRARVEIVGAELRDRDRRDELLTEIRSLLATGVST